LAEPPGNDYNYVLGTSTESSWRLHATGLGSQPLNNAYRGSGELTEIRRLDGGNRGLILANAATVALQYYFSINAPEVRRSDWADGLARTCRPCSVILAIN
jgi:hypothetical protein